MGMKYKGYNFRRATRVVTMKPDHYRDDDPADNHVRFGRVVPPYTPGAQETHWKPASGNIGLCWAKPITPDGWTRTNMMRVKGERRYYLLYEGKVYTATYPGVCECGKRITDDARAKRCWSCRVIRRVYGSKGERNE